MLISFLGGAAVSAAEAPRAIVLLQSEGFVHEVVKPRGGGPSVVEEVLSDLAERSGAFVPTFTRNAGDLTPAALRDADLVIFYTTGDVPLDTAALADWVERGGGFLGVHCAADTLKGDAGYVGLLGAAFRDHPWNAGDTVTIRMDNPSHPAAGPYAPNATFKEEIYRFRAPLPEDASMVLSLDRAATEKKVDGEEDIPVAWGRERGEGRVFYTSLGHREDVWRSERFQQHLLGAIAWLTASTDGSAVVKPADSAKPQAAHERPRDPWVFRSVLDHNARMITVALHEDLWLAYDAQDLSLYQAWAGGVELKGAVYDGRHGPQPESKVEQLYFRRTGDETPWRVYEGRREVPTTFRYLGYRIANGQVTLRGELRLEDGRVIVVSDTPEHGRIALVRTIGFENIPEGLRAAAHIAGANDATHLAADSPGSHLVWTSSDRESRELWLLRDTDGSCDVVVPLIPQE